MTVDLLKRHSRLLPEFRCGAESIDTYFHERAIQDIDAVNYCIIDKDSFVALFALSCSSISFRVESKNYVYPAVEIKMFALSESYQHKEHSRDYQWSTFVLDNVIATINEFTDTICGASHVVLYSVPKAVNFYKRNGFKEFTEYMVKNQDKYLDGCVPMFFSL